MLENKFKTGLVKDLKKRFPGCMVVHLDPNEIQGIPDLLVLYRDRWAALEGKKTGKASHRPNQDYYVAKMNEMSMAKQDNYKKERTETALSFHFSDFGMRGYISMVKPSGLFLRFSFSFW